jgi:hypothetical protein
MGNGLNGLEEFRGDVSCGRDTSLSGRKSKRVGRGLGRPVVKLCELIFDDKDDEWRGVFLKNCTGDGSMGT